VVERWIGADTAPVLGSTECPAWTARVSSRALRQSFTPRDFRRQALFCQTFHVPRRLIVRFSRDGFDLTPRSTKRKYQSPARFPDTPLSNL
jgi:hypothetical protein